MPAAAVALGDGGDIDVRLGDNIRIDSIRPAFPVIGEEKHCIVDGGVKTALDGSGAVSGGVEAVNSQSPDIPDKCGFFAQFIVVDSVVFLNQASLCNEFIAPVIVAVGVGVG